MGQTQATKQNRAILAGGIQGGGETVGELCPIHEDSIGPRSQRGKIKKNTNQEKMVTFARRGSDGGVLKNPHCLCLS